MWRLRNIVIARASYNIMARKSVSLDPIVFSCEKKEEETEKTHGECDFVALNLA